MLTLPKTFNSSDISCFKIWVTTFLYIADCAEINFSYNTCILIVVKRICEWVVNYLLIFFLFYFHSINFWFLFNLSRCKINFDLTELTEVAQVISFGRSSITYFCLGLAPLLKELLKSLEICYKSSLTLLI